MYAYRYSIFLLFLTLSGWYGCVDDQPLQSDLIEIPFLKQNSTQLDSIVDALDIDQLLGHSIIYELDGRNDLNWEDLSSLVSSHHVGGFVLDNFELQQMVDLKDSLDAISTLPLFWGIRSLYSVTDQLTDLSDSPGAVFMSFVQDEKIIKTWNTDFYNQLLALGFNLVLPEKIEPLYDDLQKRRAQEIANGLKLSKILDTQKLEYSIGFLEQDTTAIYSPRSQVIMQMLEQAPSILDVSELSFTSKTPDQSSTSNLLNIHYGYDGLLLSDVDGIEELKTFWNEGVSLLVVNETPSKYLDGLKTHVRSVKTSKRKKKATIAKVLKAALWTNSSSNRNEPPFVSVANSPSKIKEAVKAGTTLINNYRSLLPFTQTYNRNFRLLEYSDEPLVAFEDRFRSYAGLRKNFYNIDNYKTLPTINPARYKFATVIVNLNDVLLDASRDSAFVSYIDTLSETRKLVLINYGNPENIVLFDTTVTILQMSSGSVFEQKLAAEILLGGETSKGKVPRQFAKAEVNSIDNLSRTRLSYALDSKSEIDTESLKDVRRLALKGISQKAFPGCQIFALKDGKVIYNQSFGYHTYEKKKKVSINDTYDLASITKVAATSLAVMKLYEEQKIDLDGALEDYLELPDTSTIKSVTIKDLLIHESGLRSNSPISEIIRDKFQKDTCNYYFCKEKDDTHPIQVASSLFTSTMNLDSFWYKVYHLTINKKKRYRYSDNNFILLQKVVEKVCGKSLDEFCNSNFYHPLGLRRLSYTPLKKLDINEIVPTENDKSWRNEEIKGFVHDPTAALLGGVSGNAGLFATANDLAVIFQMLSWKGRYGDIQYFQSSTVHEFTNAKYSNRRGLGFDTNANKKARLGKHSSSNTFGHIGFTGTSVWVDPENDFVFVFLSNRINDNIRNLKINKFNFREKIHDVFYEAFQKANTSPEI